MEQYQFDSLARVFGGKVSRRSGFAALAAAIAGIAGAGSEATDAAPRRRAGKGGRIRPQGPCGDGGRKANTCRKNSQCCTGFCLKDLKNKDGKGRCRCIRKGQPCKPSQTCCGDRTCADGVCGQAKEACVVCASGCPFSSVNEAYASATEGAVITIDAGRYGTGIAATKSVTLKACNDVSGVILYPDGSVTSDYVNPPAPAIITDTASRTAAATLTLIGLELEPSVPSANEYLIMIYDNSYPTMLSVDLRNSTFSGSGTLANVYLTYGTHTIINSVFRDGKTGLWVENDYSGSNQPVSLTVSGSQFINNDSYGVYLDGEHVEPDRLQTVFSFTNCTLSDNGLTGAYIDGGVYSFTGCTIQNNPSFGLYATGATVTVADTLISGNGSNTTDFGGGIALSADEPANITLTLSGTTSITGNTATNGSGIGTSQGDLTTTITVVGAGSNVTGNLVGPQCSRNTTNPANWSAVPNCAF